MNSHLTQEEQHQAREHTLAHQYDELGNRIATTLPDGKIINQLYYGSGHLYNQSLHDPSTDEYIELRHSERNKLHQEISRQQGSLTSSYHYDPMGRLIQQQSLKHQLNHEQITIQRSYHYDALGQLTHLTGISQRHAKSTEPFKRNHQYQYDKIGRLTEHKLTDYQNHIGITEVFAFDPASNRVPVKVGEDSTDKTQTDMPKKEHGRPRELIQNGKRIRYTYDSQGRVLYKTFEAVTHPDTSPRTALQLEYNANNELAKSLRTQYQGGQVVKTQTVYHYDAFGRRIAKQSQTRHLIKNKDQIRQINRTQFKQTHFLWNGDLPIQEYSDRHVYTTVYDQDSFTPVARLMWLRDDLPEPINSEIKVKQDNPHLPIETESTSKIQVYHYHNDQLGTPNELTDSEGKVIWLADYEAWGETRKELCWEHILASQDESYARVEGELVWHEQVSKEHLQPIRFQGQYFDNETGLHYNRFRYYDPNLGMFTSRDPIGLMGGDNVFAYAPNPTGWIDPLGLEVSVANSAKTAGKFARGVPGVIWQAITPTTMGDASLPIDPKALERVRAKAKEKTTTDKRCTNSYYHYTNYENYQTIVNSGYTIKSNARGQVYLTPFPYSPKQAQQALFMGSPYYKGKGDYVIKMQIKCDTPLVPGTQPNELIHHGSLRLGRQITQIQYSGPNLME